MARSLKAMKPIEDTRSVEGQEIILGQMCRLLEPSELPAIWNQAMIQVALKGHPLIPPPEERWEDAGMANTLFSYMEGDLRFSAEAIILILHGMAPLMAGRAEDFFLPESWMPYHARPWEMKDTLELIETHFTRNISRERPPQRHEEAPPGRNDPCPCGSGQKYKRCCGKGA